MFKVRKRTKVLQKKKKSYIMITNTKYFTDQITLSKRNVQLLALRSYFKKLEINSILQLNEYLIAQSSMVSMTLYFEWIKRGRLCISTGYALKIKL